MIHVDPHERSVLEATLRQQPPLARLLRSLGGGQRSLSPKLFPTTARLCRERSRWSPFDSRWSAFADGVHFESAARVNLSPRAGFPSAVHSVVIKLGLGRISARRRAILSRHGIFWSEVYELEISGLPGEVFHASEKVQRLGKKEGRRKFNDEEGKILT